MVKPTAMVSQPRRVGGGRSLLHGARHVWSGYSVEYAPEWGDASARIVFDALRAMCTKQNKITVSVLNLFRDEAALVSFAASAGRTLSVHERKTMLAILRWNQRKVLLCFWF